MEKLFNYIVLGAFISLVLVIYFQSFHESAPKNVNVQLSINDSSWYISSLNRIQGVRTRDFVRYDCKNMVRIGGPPEYLKNAPHPLYRIDGAWFICLDGNLAPRKDNCNILSFGINHDFTFDEIMNKEYGCRVHSFDPFVEAGFFKDIRRKNKSLNKSSILPVNPKWTFYRWFKLGLTTFLCFFVVVKL